MQPNTVDILTYTLATFVIYSEDKYVSVDLFYLSVYSTILIRVSAKFGRVILILKYSQSFNRRI